MYVRAKYILAMCVPYISRINMVSIALRGIENTIIFSTVCPLIYSSPSHLIYRFTAAQK